MRHLSDGHHGGGPGRGRVPRTPAHDCTDVTPQSHLKLSVDEGLSIRRVPAVGTLPAIRHVVLSRCHQPLLVSIVRTLVVALVILTCASVRAQSQAAAPPASTEAPPQEDEASEAEEEDDGPFRIHDALHAPDWLILNGSQRTRYSGLANQFRPGLDDSDQALALRTLFTLGATFGPVSIVGELQDSRAYLTDENSGISTIVVNALEPLQAYVNLHLDDVFIDGAGLDLRAGRQTMDLGGRRLIARNRFRNTIQNYTGITSHWLTSGTELFAFGVLPVRVDLPNSDREGLLDNRIEIRS
jgi:hypothetical protein